MSGDKIVLIATHVVSDIEFISKEILLMKNGRVVDKDCPEALQKKIAGKVFEIRIVQEELNQVKKEFEISNLFRTRGKLSCVHLGRGLNSISLDRSQSNAGRCLIIWH